MKISTAIRRSVAREKRVNSQWLFRGKITATVTKICVRRKTSSWCSSVYSLFVFGLRWEGKGRSKVAGSFFKRKSTFRGLRNVAGIIQNCRKNKSLRQNKSFKAQGPPCEIISEDRIYIQCAVVIRSSLEDVSILTQRSWEIVRGVIAEISAGSIYQAAPRSRLAALDRGASRRTGRRERREESRCWRNVRHGRVAHGR